MRTIQLIDGKAVFVDIPEPEPEAPAAPESKPAEPVTKAKRQPKKK